MRRWIRGTARVATFACLALPGFGQSLHFLLSGDGLSHYFISAELGYASAVETDSSPGAVSWHDLKLSRGLTADMSLWEWRAQVESGEIEAARRDFSLVAMDDSLQPIARWDFGGGWPREVVLRTNEEGWPLETVCIAFESFTRARFYESGANRAPGMNLPPSFLKPAGTTASFIVEVKDPDGDLVSVINLLRPPGATFAGGVFTWNIPAAAAGTEHLVTFRAADDQTPSETTTDSLTITVPEDYDQDAMHDGWEVLFLGGIDALPEDDKDADGSNNLREFNSATDPGDPYSVFRVTHIAEENGQVAVTFRAEPDVLYRLQINPHMGPTGWTDVGLPWLAAAADETGTLTAEIPTGPTFFYRILARRL